MIKGSKKKFLLFLVFAKTPCYLFRTWSENSKILADIDQWFPLRNCQILWCRTVFL